MDRARDTSQALFVGQVLRIVLAIAVVFAVVTALVSERPLPITSIHGVVILAALAGLWLVKRGRARAAAVSFLLMAWAIVTVSVMLLGGTRSPGFFTYFALVLLAGFMWSERAAIAFGIASIVAALAIAVLESHGLLPTPLVPVTGTRLLEALVALIAVTGFALHFATRSVRESLREAHANAELARDATRAAERRARQQGAVARLGERALESRSLEGFFEECAQVLVHVMNADFAKVLELAPDRQSLVLRAGVGWHPGVVGHVRVPADKSSQAGYTLASEAPVLVEDFESETRFEAPALLRDHDVRSGISVVIATQERSFGVLAVHSRTSRSFQREDVPFMQSIANLLSAALARADLETRVARSQQLEALGRFAGGIAHDFNNMLTVILNYTDAFDQPADDAERAIAAGEIRDAAERAASLTRDLLAFARSEPTRPEAIQLNDIATRSSRMLGRLLGDRCRLELQLDPALHPTWADPGQIERILVNLVVNARDAMPHGGKITVETSNQSGDGRDRVRLAVHDGGLGMAPEVQQRAFEPFFTTKPSGMGTGLGLSTIYGLVRQIGGEIQIRSHEGLGTSVEIDLPRTHERCVATEEAVPFPTEERPVRGETVLLAEDDDRLRALLVRSLTQAGYTVLEARDGREALGLAQRHSERIGALVSDVVMPGVSGFELGASIRATCPSVRTIYMSGYSENQRRVDEARRIGARFLQKPFRSEELLHALRETARADSAPAASENRESGDEEQSGILRPPAG